MSTIRGPEHSADGAPSEVDLARPALGERWAKSLARTAYSPMARRRIRRELDAHVAALVALLRAEEFTADPAGSVGDWLVASRYTGQRSLQATVDLLGPALRTDPALTAVPDLADRVTFVLSALSAGYANAVRNQIFEEQEKVRNSLLLTLTETQQELHDSEARFRQVFASSAAGIAILDLPGDLVEVNPALVRMLGHEADVPDEVFTPDDLAELRTSCHRMLVAMEESSRFEHRFTGAGGEEIWANVVLSVVRDSDDRPKYYVAVTEDVTDQRRLREYLRFQALHDVLTGLPNWQSFLPHLEKVLGGLRVPDTITLCYLDVDSMAIINDGLGYHAGDRVLTEIARRLTAVVSSETAMVARAGGDEFVILVKDSPTTPSISQLAEAVDTALAAPITIDGHRSTAVSACMGFVRTSARGTDAATLVRQAHSTLRGAERKGKRQWAYYDHDQDKINRPRLVLLAALPGALATGDIYTEFQPVDNTATIANLRWELQDDTVLHHTDCLDHADELGHTIPLAHALLTQACTRASEDPDSLPVLVRLSPEYTRDPDLTRTIGTILTTTGLPPNHLWLSLSLQGMTDVEGEDNLAVLKDMDVHVLLHDLTGNTEELSIVEQHTPHAVILAPTPDSKIAKAATAALIPLLHETGALVIAEESTPDQSKWYRSIGVDLLLPTQPAPDEY
ncbi:diguanylate cyclase domain-containing protein [Umezawaea tangerina]|uniref:PAS domain S-box-containing protein/diguanylate cyclase (GGDEF)-like protein n=1 Tax=Umezawaea tangerina TaxID=84725 RepID=A0A2T0SJZ2_9PSEU|nr:diguanylate cyclase [Umezawaea tangerina]PRY33730.1 PAS domain S-box-containing protein/diguanylate cyclase (GGDEF)-like protein [Umezawaea tangerina]